MTQEHFEALVQNRVHQCLTTLTAKGEGYADADRLDHFRRAALLTDDTLEMALWGMAVKHFVSVAKLCRDAEPGPVPEKDLPVWDEKIGDAINYLLILSAMVHGSEARV